MTRSHSTTIRPFFHSQPILIWSNNAFRLRCPIADNTILNENKSTRLPTNFARHQNGLQWHRTSIWLVCLHLTCQRSFFYPCHHQLRTVHDWWTWENLHQHQESGLRTSCWNLRQIPGWSCLYKNCRTRREDLQESSEYGQWPLHSGRPHSTLQTNPAGTSQIACRWTRPKSRTKSRRRNAKRSKQTDPKYGGEWQANQMVIRLQKMDHRRDISHLWRLVMGLDGKTPHNSPNKGVRFSDNTNLDSRSEWKLPLRGRFTCRHYLPSILVGWLECRFWIQR